LPEAQKRLNEQEVDTAPVIAAGKLPGQLLRIVVLYPFSSTEFNGNEAGFRR
jgi:hypothetical protein